MESNILLSGGNQVPFYSVFIQQLIQVPPEELK